MRRYVMNHLAFGRFAFGSLATFGSIAVGCLATGCSSPSINRYVAADGERERGLGDLRQKLAMGSPSGRVVAGADGQWLVHAESGQRLLRIPEGDWQGKPVTGLTMLFEGTPGAALVFDHQNVGLARFDHATGKAVWVPVLVPSLPPATTPLLVLETAFGESALVIDESPVEARIEVAGREPLTASIGREGLVIKQGEEAIFDRLQTTMSGTYCSGNFSATLRTTKRPDGAVLLRYESVTTWVGDGETCDPEYRPAGTDKDLVWLEIGAHGEAPRVVWSDWAADVEEPYNLSDGHSRIIETLAGTFEYSGANEGQGGWDQDSWSWKLTPPGGEPITLVDVSP